MKLVYSDCEVTPMRLVTEGDKSWRVAASLDDNNKLTGEFCVRLPDKTLVAGYLVNYRELRSLVSREVYLLLRNFKRTYEAEQAGMVGCA